MFKLILLFVMVSASLSVQALTLDGKSAARAPGESYLKYKSVATAIALRRSVDSSADTTPVDSSVEFGQAKLRDVVEWESVEEMTKQFLAIRDERFLTWQVRPEMKRRSSWLFPDDGCFARAQLANYNLHNWKVTSPDKVYVFGDLNVETANSLSGSVSWWYHVAPIVQVKGVKYVLDPALNPAAPLKLEEWLALQSDRPERLEVAICSSGTYTPYDGCSREIGDFENEAIRDQGSYLGQEWNRLEDLGRDPELELGDLPPWQTRE